MGLVERVTGIHAVASALAETPERVVRVLIQAAVRPHPARDAIVMDARQRGIPVEEEQTDYFKRLAAGRNTQGVAAELRSFAYTDLEDLVRPGTATPLVVVLDGVSDPHNLGAVLRSAAFFGATGVVIPKDRAVHVNPTVERAAAGGAAMVPVAMVTNLARALDDLKQAGLWVVGSVPTGGEALAAVDFCVPTALVLGAEGPGMRRLTTERCDRLATLPPLGRMESLNVSVFAGIFLYEAIRQRTSAAERGTGVK